MKTNIYIYIYIYKMSVLLDFLIKIKFLALPNIIIIRAVSEICNIWEM